MAHIKSRGFALQARDEHRYTKRLRKLFHHPNVERLDEKSVLITVKIDAQGNIISSYGKIGEIGWDDQDRYFELYGRQEHTTECKLYTRTGELFGAYLSITLGKPTANKLLAKNLPNIELTPIRVDETKEIGGGFWAKLFGWLKQ